MQILRPHRRSAKSCIVKSHILGYLKAFCAQYIAGHRDTAVLNAMNKSLHQELKNIPLPILHDTHKQVTTVEALLHAFKLRVASLHVASKLVAFMAMIKILLYC